MTREEAIDLLSMIEFEQAECCLHTWYKSIDDDMKEALDMAIKALEQTRWIPVSERLPEESLNSVIGLDAYRERCVFVQYIDGHFQIMGKAESFDIIAWMPLPQPYKEESEDAE